MIKKNGIITLLITAVACFIAALGFAFTGATMQAIAAENDFCMLGASLRYTSVTSEEDNGTGIRFEMKAKEEFIASADDIGFVIVPSKYVAEGAQLNVTTEKAVINPKHAADWKDIEGEDGYKKASVYVYGIPDMDKDTELSAVGYAKVDGAYQYTETVKRSMKYISVAASIDENQTEEVRAAVERYTDKGNVAYFDNEEVKGLLGTAVGYSSWAANGVADSDVWGETKKVTDIGINTTDNGWWATYTIKTPAIKNVNNYKYFSFLIRASHADSVRLSVNETAKVVPSTSWQRIVFTNDNGTFTSEYGNLFAAGSEVAPATAQNLNGFRMVFGGNACGTNGMTHVYLADMYVSDELPQISLSLPDYKMKGESENISATATEADGATVSVSVSVNGAEEKSVANDASYLFNEAGEHKFTVTLEKDGKVLDVKEKIVYCVNSNGNEVIYSGNRFGEKINELSGWQQGVISFDETVTIPGETEKGALKVTYGQEGAATAFSAKNVSIADVSSYSFVYFDVYNPQERDIDFTIAWTYGYPVTKILAQSWTRIILSVYGGSIYLPNAYKNQQGNYSTLTGITSGDFNDVQFAAIGLNSGEYFLIGNVYAATEKPAIPEGIGYFTDGKVAVFGSGSVIAHNGIASAFGSAIYYSGNLRDYVAESLTLIDSGEWNLTGFDLTLPDIKDISSYEYMYIDVFSYDETIKFTPNYGYGAAYVNVANDGKWHRVVLQNNKNGNFTVLNHDGRISADVEVCVFGVDGSAAKITDITGLRPTAVTSAAGKTMAIGTIRVCNELPELPANVVYANYTPAA